MLKRILLVGGIVLSTLTSSAVFADVTAATQTAQQVCAACHAADGNSVIPANPKLAGQHADYLLKQLQDFKANPSTRSNAVMSGMAAGLDAAAARDIAEYFASQKPSPGVSGNAKTVDLGRRIWRAGIKEKGVPACAGCHGPGGHGLPAQYPRLAGQHTEYLEAQLKLFRNAPNTDDASQKRENDPAKMMRMIAERMSDLDIRAVSDYAAGLQ